MLHQQTIRKRFRETDDHIDSIDRSKAVNRNLIAFDFRCSAYCKGQILDFQLSQVFQKFKYSLLFFCSYDLYEYFYTQESREDLTYIQKSYSKFVKYETLPIVITQDRAQIHEVYATPGMTSGSLNFEPLFIMASDCKDRLISRFYKSIIMSMFDTQRAVVIIDHQFQVVFAQSVLDETKLPMDLLFHFLKR